MVDMEVSSAALDSIGPTAVDASIPIALLDTLSAFIPVRRITAILDVMVFPERLDPSQSQLRGVNGCSVVRITFQSPQDLHVDPIVATTQEPEQEDRKARYSEDEHKPFVRQERQSDEHSDRNHKDLAHPNAGPRDHDPGCPSSLLFAQSGRRQLAISLPQ